MKQRLQSAAPSRVIDESTKRLVWELIWELNTNLIYKLGWKLIGTLMGKWFGGLLVRYVISLVGSRGKWAAKWT